MIRIANASPLITLAKAGLHDLLLNSSDELFILDAVALEIEAGPADDQARSLLLARFGTRLPPTSVPEAILEWGLGAGESAVVIETMRRQGAEAILDDAAARRCARSFGIPVIGTLGIVARAKLMERIAAAAPLFMALRDVGLFFTDELAVAVLAGVGESWSP